MTASEFGFVTEKERSMNLVITEVIPMGYGNPDANISYDKQIESGELLPEVVARSKELIHNGECMRPVTDDDDGCIDGRPTVEVLYVTENGEFYTKMISNPGEHVRETVAGGGYVTGYAMLRGIGIQGNSIDDDFGRIGEIMTEGGVHCGAHTGAHSHEDKSTDCGANDKIRDIIENGVAYRINIGKDVKALLEAGSISYDDKVFSRVIDRWSNSLTDNSYFENSNGATRFTKIQESIRNAQAKDGTAGKSVSVSKHLAGDHKEDFILVNYVEGYHFSQPAFAEKLAESFPDIPAEKRAQIFTVDVPRIVKLAKAISSNEKILRDRNIDSETLFQETLYAGVAFQLATAATLTDGSLPMFLVHEAA